MKKHPAHSLHVVSLLAAGMTLGAAPVFSAALGPIQVRSALGERLDAVIQVTTASGEELSSSCFRVGTPQDDDGGSVLRGVQMTWEPQGSGSGRLRLRTSDPVTEPVMQLPVQVKCGSDDTRDFRRDYTLLLDPRDYRGAVISNGSNDQATAPVAAAPARATRRKLPAPGESWTVRAGDTVESIASNYYPHDGAARRQFIESMYAQNPDLPQGYRVPLSVDTQITLPGKVAAPASEAAPRAPKAARKPAASATTGRSVLRLDDSPPDTPSPSTASAPAVAAIANQAASEDQQLALLKTQIAQLQQELAQLKLQAQQQLTQPATANAVAPAANTANTTVPAATAHPHAPVHVAAPVPEKSGGLLDWLLFPLILLLLVGVMAWSYLRWKSRQREASVAEDEYAMQFANGMPDEDVHTVLPPAAGAGARGAVASPLAARAEPQRELANHITQIANEWQNSTMDVVQPGNVLEEAQLLLDHGLLQQAINLLIQEIEQHPALATLWLKLLSIYSQHQMKADFLDYARQFREQFTDEDLWRQVQVMGASVDPDNALYQLSEEDAASLPDYRKESTLKQSIGGTLPDHPSTPSPEAEAEFESLMRTQAGLALTDSEWTLAEDHEALPRKPLAEHVPFDTRQPVLETPVEEEPAAAFFGNEMEFDLDALPPLEAPAMTEPVALAAAAPVAAAGPVVPAKPEPSAFRSDDPQMQKIATLLEHGQEGEAMRALEETLYSGSGAQRQLALKWLSQLQPRAFDK
ncbi:Tfp pilus assembly protein FimV [Silvimonas terrae]|uniref:Tfp pilus assembly protein FimV n=1 Tax=Silvimonas terrae TaxID=300266 RepID=A0A840RDV7_9NEIS|nr:hypothetical protein [Silvimonas terrae]MBB5191515.1 Tfp pilus assembly protein FimV [Silvimonas terrae]